MTERIKPLTQIQKKYLKERVDDIISSFNREMERADNDIKPNKIDEKNTLFKALECRELDWLDDRNLAVMLKSKINRGNFSTYYSSGIGTVELKLVDLIVGLNDFVERRKEIAEAQTDAKRRIKKEYHLKASNLTDKAILEGTDISEQVELFRLRCNEAVEQFIQEWKHVDTWEKAGKEVNMAEASEMVA
jgi:hypothetical protein